MFIKLHGLLFIYIWPFSEGVGGDAPQVGRPLEHPLHSCPTSHCKFNSRNKITTPHPHPPPQNYSQYVKHVRGRRQGDRRIIFRRRSSEPDAACDVFLKPMIARIQPVTSRCRFKRCVLSSHWSCEVDVDGEGGGRGGGDTVDSPPLPPPPSRSRLPPPVLLRGCALLTAHLWARRILLHALTVQLLGFSGSHFTGVFKLIFCCCCLFVSTPMTFSDFSEARQE